jgi:hypothetical protein
MALDAPKQAKTLKHRPREARSGREPDVDPARIGAHLGIGLDHPHGREPLADHELAKLVKPISHKLDRTRVSFDSK